MTALLGFRLDFWDYATFAALAFVGLGLLVGLVWLAGLPGRIAIARNHPDAEAVNMMGWAGFLAAVPWIQAFIWAFKPTDIVDIRRFPPEEREAVAETIARLRGEQTPGAKVVAVKQDVADAERASSTPPARRDQ